ncbi:galactose oxidase [Rickenella mellea]|uniref:Galactose oxidase n=1 Tax=Rickenella mellea TaxID=50990 RepID=A0A4Y7PST1_9AGAM|nr:galactose oxidase [Rickenella mellea]
MHSVSDLTTFSRKTTGDVPPRLVGASTTVVGDKMYLFGGRLVMERRMVSELYAFDMETYVWERITYHPDDDVPGARYFHSTDAWRGYLVLFGGMGHKTGSEPPEELFVLNDVRFFDLNTRRWLPPSPQPQPQQSPSQPSSDSEAPNNPSSTSAADPSASASSLIPRPRYAHLSSITSSRLFVIGGQDLNNLWLDDLCVFDLVSLKWVQRKAYPRHSGTYRSVAVAGTARVRYPMEEMKGAAGGGPTTTTPTLGGVPGARFKTEKTPPASIEFTPPESYIHQSYTAEPTDEYPNDIYLYSNYNFTDVKRELEIFTPLPAPSTSFRMTDLSASMSGTALPPGLRFPTGAICGNHLIFGGTYLAHSYQSFSIWALDLGNMCWTRLDPGAALASGSWFKGVLWPAARPNAQTHAQSPRGARFVIFGNRAGNLVEDYNRRLLSWDDVAFIDLESFGIYQPPPLSLSLKSQQLGLAALEEGVLADFEVVCDDGRKIKVSRKVLEGRWGWFRRERERFLAEARRAIEGIGSESGGAGGVETPLVEPADLDTKPPDPRLTPRSLLLSEPYPITLALMQYFYTLSLLTPLQHAPAVLSQLLLLSATYELPHLQGLVKHAMHSALSSATSVGVYEVATLCSCQSLQIRALKLVMVRFFLSFLFFLSF